MTVRMHPRFPRMLSLPWASALHWGDGAWRPPSKELSLWLMVTDLAAVLFHAGRVRKEGAARRGGRHYKDTRKNGFHLTVLLGHSKEFSDENRGGHRSRGRPIHHKNQRKRDRRSRGHSNRKGRRRGRGAGSLRPRVALGAPLCRRQNPAG